MYLVLSFVKIMYCLKTIKIHTPCNAFNFDDQKFDHRTEYIMI